MHTLVTLIGEAVFARTLSALKDERVRASKIIAGPQKEPFRGDKQMFIDDLEQALYASKIISYTQGFMLMRQTASDVRSSVLSISLVYISHSLAGTSTTLELPPCGVVDVSSRSASPLRSLFSLRHFMQSVFLSDITKAYNKDIKLESLLFDDFFNKGAQ